MHFTHGQACLMVLRNTTLVAPGAAHWGRPQRWYVKGNVPPHNSGRERFPRIYSEAPAFCGIICTKFGIQIYSGM